LPFAEALGKSTGTNKDSAFEVSLLKAVDTCHL
jgi:hypothetical protein